MKIASVPLDDKERLKDEELKRAYADLELFSFIASHDLKSPLNNIISLTHLLKDGYATKLDADGNEYISYLNDAAYQLSDLINGMLIYSRSAHLSTEQKETIDITALTEEITDLLKAADNVTISYDTSHREVYSSRAALKQIMLHLLQNAVKPGNNPQILVSVKAFEDADNYVFEVTDNGNGIGPELHEKIFDLQEALNNKNKTEQNAGIGLCVAKRLVEKLDGEIKATSDIGNGSTFTISIPKC